MIKAIIVEDEKLARDLIHNYLIDHPDIQVTGEYEDGFSGLKAINEMKPDLVFLDIQMPKLTGFEMLEILDHKPVIIFNCI
jgi:two-component system LytT family response regulator